MFHLRPILFKDNAKSFIENNLGKIEELADRLEDDESREVLENVLNYWISGNTKLLMKYREQQNNQYLDTLSFSDNEVFVNVGACDGRYSRLFAEKVRKYSAIYNLECDPTNYQVMLKKLVGYSDMFFLQLGAYDSKAVMMFDSMGNSSSFLCKEGNTVVELDTIDNIFSEVSVTFIKADIEGAESKMLCGARDTLNTKKPKLAVCCYHQVEDLVEIPNLILRINKDYHIKIRHYTDTLTETVCYAY